MKDQLCYLKVTFTNKVQFQMYRHFVDLLNSDLQHTLLGHMARLARIDDANDTIKSLEFYVNDFFALKLTFLTYIRQCCPPCC